MITEEMLAPLRDEVCAILSEHRFRHTLAVEKAARFLAEHCLPDKITEIAAAAILHDVTKELSVEDQVRIVSENGLDVDVNDKSFSKVAHSYTAPIFVKEKFPAFATPEVLSAIEKHTLGDVNMTVFDKIIFLADFIEKNRTYEDCISTAKFVYDSMKLGEVSENVSILDKACIMEIDSTINSLIKRNLSVNERTLLTRSALISKK